MSLSQAVWACLAIEPTDDIQVVKKAYAKQLKIWKKKEEIDHLDELKTAYNTILRWIETKDQTQEPIYPPHSQEDNNTDIRKEDSVSSTPHPATNFDNPANDQLKPNDNKKIIELLTPLKDALLEDGSIKQEAEEAALAIKDVLEGSSFHEKRNIEGQLCKLLYQRLYSYHFFDFLCELFQWEKNNIFSPSDKEYYDYYESLWHNLNELPAEATRVLEVYLEEMVQNLLHDETLLDACQLLIKLCSREDLFNVLGAAEIHIKIIHSLERVCDIEMEFIALLAQRFNWEKIETQDIYSEAFRRWHGIYTQSNHEGYIKVLHTLSIPLSEEQCQLISNSNYAVFLSIILEKYVASPKDYPFDILEENIKKLNQVAPNNENEAVSTIKSSPPDLSLKDVFMCIFLFYLLYSALKD